MTRQEEIGACIATLQNRIPVKANAIHGYGEDDTRLKCTRRKCKYLIEDLEDLLGYLKELEELKNK